MKKLHLLLLVFTFATSVSAHDYQLVRSDRVCLYQSVNGNTNQYPFIGLLIDSMKLIGTDSLYYPNVNLQQKGSYYRMDGSWIGKRIVVKANGENLIINSDNDSILIKTKSVLNDSWIVYQKNNMMQIVAEVTGIEKMSFFDLEDTVKTIVFHVYDASMKPLPNQYDGSQIKISKNFGLIESLPFYAFPNVISYNPVLYYRLSGMTNPKVGVQNLTAEDVFDFQPGDEYHTVFAKGVSLGFVNKDSVMTIERILERGYVDNHISYKIDVTERHYYWEWSTQTKSNEFRHDTITFNVNESLIEMFSMLPEEVSQKNMMGIPSMYSANTKSFYSSYLNQVDSVNWSEIWLTGGVICSGNSYLKGFGGPYYECFGSYIYENRKLVYSKKGGVETGTKLIISSTPSIYKENAVNIFPIAGRKELKTNILSSELPVRLELLSVSGTVVFRESIDSESSVVSLHSLPSGAYLYRVRGASGELVCGKVLLH